MTLTPREIRQTADRLGVRPSKRLGQNFVVEPGTVRQIAALAALRADDTVLEIGPGLGSLTLALLEAGASKLVAVEIDPVLAAELPHTLAARAGQAPAAAEAAVTGAGEAGAVGEPGGGQVTVLNADALAVTEADVGTPTVLVANLPYNVAVPVLLHLLAVLPSLDRGLIMVQAEVADRLCAGPGSRVYGAPSVKLAWYASARLAGTVPRTVFWPVPNVDSKLVAFTRHDPPANSVREPASGAAAVSRQDVFAVIEAAFGQRRKTLRAALAGWAGSAPVAERILRAAGVDPGARGESLTVTQFARVAAARSM